MKPAAFGYTRADSVAAAVAELARHGEDARIIAGGQSLGPMLNLRLAQPTAIVDIAGVPGLSYVRREGALLRIGALTRHQQLEHVAAPLRGYDAVRDAAPHIGHPPIRVRGTFGGSIAHADPTAEWCVAATLHDATVRLVRPTGERDVAIDDFLVGPFMTATAPAEVITEVTLQRPYECSAFVEVARQHGDFALAAAAVGFDVRDGYVSGPAVAVAGIGGRAHRVEALQRALDGLPVRDGFAGVRRRCQEVLDEGASDGVVARMAAELVVRALERAARRDRVSPPGGQA